MPVEEGCSKSAHGRLLLRQECCFFAQKWRFLSFLDVTLSDSADSKLIKLYFQFTVFLVLRNRITCLWLKVSTAAILMQQNRFSKIFSDERKRHWFEKNNQMNCLTQFPLFSKRLTTVACCVVRIRLKKIKSEHFWGKTDILDAEVGVREPVWSNLLRLACVIFRKKNQKSVTYAPPILCDFWDPSKSFCGWLLRF